MKYEDVPSGVRRSFSKVGASARCGSSHNGRKKTFSLSREELASLYERSLGRCEVTGIPFDLSYPVGVQKPRRVSIDRIDCSRDYTYDNCRLVCVQTNYALNQWGVEELRRFISDIIEMKVLL